MVNLLISFSSFDSTWSVLTQFFILIVAVFLGNIIRAKVPFIRKALIPSSLIGGFIILMLKFIPSFKTFVEGSDVMSLVTYHCIGLSFAAMALKNVKKGNATKTGVLNNGFLQGGVYIGQAALGLGLCLLLYVFTKNSSNPIQPEIGAILSLGFAQGPGNAMIYSTNYLGTSSFGLVIATIGFIVASVVGITYMNILKRKGKLVIRELPKGDLRKVSDYEGENEIPPTESVDKLTIQIALLLISYALAYGVMYGLNILFTKLSSIIGIDINFSFGFNFLWGALCAYAVKITLNFLKKINVVKREYTNNYIIDRMSGLFFDLMVCAGVASIKFEEVKGLVLPIVVLCIAGTIFTFFYIRAVCKECFKGYENEAFLANFGTLTGQLGNGMILLREVDPTYVTPASYNLILLQLPLLFVLLPELLLLDYNGSSVIATLITFIIWTVVFIIYTIILFRRRIFKSFYKDKPQEIWTEK